MSSMRLLCPAILLTAFVSACQGEGLLPPEGPPEQPPGPPPIDAGPPPPPPPPPGPVKRTVEVRSWVGGPAGNLLSDGDFELSGTGNGQAGWVAFNSQQQTRYEIETGGLCKSGLRCAKAKSGMVFYGRGTAAPQGKRNFGAIWAKLPVGPAGESRGHECKEVSAQLVICDTFQVLGKLKRDEDLPDAKGWCHYQGDVPPQARAVCMYVDHDLTGDDLALLDGGILAPSDGTVILKSAEAWAPSPAKAARMEEIADLLRRTQPF